MLKIIRMLILALVAILLLTACSTQTRNRLATSAAKHVVAASEQTTSSSLSSTATSIDSSAEATTAVNELIMLHYAASKQPAPIKKQPAPAKKQPVPTKKPSKPVAAVATVVSSPSSATGKGKIVVIDPGHANHANLATEPVAPGSSTMKIKDGGGATGIVTKTPEYLVNMDVALKLRTLLQQRGFTVIMTKTDNSVSLGNVERAEIGNNVHANLVIRIHADSSVSTSASGASMLIPEAINSNTRAIAGESKRCGQIVLNTLVKEVGMKDRGLMPRSDITGFNWSKVPVILVEMGFLSNPTEDRLLSSGSYQDKLAKGLADGIAVALN